jgi:hypothetical protein
MAGYNGTLTGGGAGDISFWPGTTWCTTAFSSTDVSGFATFGFSTQVGGVLPNLWLVGDSVVLHMANGENSILHAEYEIFGLPIDRIGEVGAGTSTFIDNGATINNTYSYFVVAEDYAGNQSAAAAVTALIDIPPRGSVYWQE